MSMKFDELRRETRESIESIRVTTGEAIENFDVRMTSVEGRYRALESTVERMGKLVMSVQGDVHRLQKTVDASNAETKAMLEELLRRTPAKD